MTGISEIKITLDIGTASKPDRLDIIVIRCKWCESLFVPKRDKHQFCKEKCREAWKNARPCQ